MSKRGRKSKDGKFAMKWKSVRVIPNEDFTNAIESTQTMRDRIESVTEYIDVELNIQARIFKHMGCDQTISIRALTALREAYETSPANKKE